MVDEEFINLRPDWSEADGLPTGVTNTFITLLGAPAGPMGIPDGILLTLGYARPPLLIGTPEDNAETIRQLNGKLSVSALGTFAMSRERAEELAGLLTLAVQQYDEQARGAVQNHA